MSERASLLPDRENVPATRTEVRCAYCDRMVEVVNHPDHGLVLMGHRVNERHAPGDAWCDGGGRHP